MNIPSTHCRASRNQPRQAVIIGLRVLFKRAIIMPTLGFTGSTPAPPPSPAPEHIAVTEVFVNLFGRKIIFGWRAFAITAGLAIISRFPMKPAANLKDDSKNAAFNM